jgi:hypothetical protein
MTVRGQGLVGCVGKNRGLGLLKVGKPPASGVSSPLYSDDGQKHQHRTVKCGVGREDWWFAGVR